jgi:Ser/Thr protein kinase RdoA (MazF antagonist)
LGSLNTYPVQVSGGLRHKIYKLYTSKGMYAVKVLRSADASNDATLSQIINSEKIAQFAHDNSINALPAITINGNTLFHIDGQYVLAYPWFNGKADQPNSIDTTRCASIGGLLARIHKLDFSSIAYSIEKHIMFEMIDWYAYSKIAHADKHEWYDIYSYNLSTLENLQDKAIAAYQKLNHNLVISHRDLLQKNVLWDIDKVPMIIDWESAGYINPGLDLLDVSLFWSGGHKGVPDTQAINSFMKSYIVNGGDIPHDFNDIIHARFLSKLDWLEYNLKSALGIDCADIDERSKCSKRVIKTIDSILVYIKIIPELNEYLYGLKNGVEI